jgi:hypothetical protein
MSAGLDRIELTTATLFEALQRLAGIIRADMDRIDRAGGAPTPLQLDTIRNQIVEFQSLMAILDRALSKTREGGAFVREIVGGISAKLLSRALAYETAHAARLQAQAGVPLFGAVIFARDLRQLDRLAEQVPSQSADLEAQVAQARSTLQTLIGRCPEIANFG